MYAFNATWKTGAMALMIMAIPPIGACAGEPQSPYDVCMASAQNSMAYRECGAAEIARQDRLLNDAWRRLAESLKSESDDAYRALLDEQRKWNAFKESACLYYYKGFGSLGTSVQYPACLIGILKQRTEYLTRFYLEQTGKQ